MGVLTGNSGQIQLWVCVCVLTGKLSDTTVCMGVFTGNDGQIQLCVWVCLQVTTVGCSCVYWCVYR